MVGRALAVIAIAALASLLTLAALSLSPDLPLETLKSRYGSIVLSQASAFLPVGDGHAVHYRDQGQRAGTTLLLLHDADSSLDAFDSWNAPLGQRYRLVSLDLPGHGLTGPIPEAEESMDHLVAFLARFADALSLQNVVLVGNGMGAHLAWRYALAYPQRVRALVLLAPEGLPDEQPAAPAAPFLMRHAESPLFGHLARYANLESYLRAVLKFRVFDKTRVREDEVARAWLLLRRAGNRASFLARRARPAADPLAADIGALAAPTLLLWGEKDAVSPLANAARFNTAIRRCQLIVFEQAGHAIQEEAAVESAGVIDSFLLGEPVAVASGGRIAPRDAESVAPLPPKPITPVEIEPLGPLRLPSP